MVGLMFVWAVADESSELEHTVKSLFFPIRDLPQCNLWSDIISSHGYQLHLSIIKKNRFSYESLENSCHLRIRWMLFRVLREALGYLWYPCVPLWSHVSQCNRVCLQRCRGSIMKATCKEDSGHLQKPLDVFQQASRALRLNLRSEVRSLHGY